MSFGRQEAAQFLQKLNPSFACSEKHFINFICISLKLLSSFLFFFQLKAEIWNSCTQFFNRCKYFLSIGFSNSCIQNTYISFIKLLIYCNTTIACKKTTKETLTNSNGGLSFKTKEKGNVNSNTNVCIENDKYDMISSFIMVFLQPFIARFSCIIVAVYILTATNLQIMCEIQLRGFSNECKFILS